MRRLALVLMAGAMLAAGQTKPFVRASGEGVLSYKPDQLKISFTMVWQAETAQAAADQTATATGAVMAAIQKLLGAGADLKTTSYSVTPVYKYPSGSAAVLAGFQASHTLELTTTSLEFAGRLIDAAASAGASSIGGLRYGLKDPQPARREALKIAAQQAKANAEAMAAGLGGRLGSVQSLEEGGGTVGAVMVDAKAMAAPQTTIETGLVTVSATVVLQAELVN